MNMRTARGLALILLVCSGCVSAGKYDEAVAKTQLTQAELDRTKSSLVGTTEDLRKRQEEVKALEAQIDEISRAAHDDRSKSVKNLDDLRKRLDELRATRAPPRSVRRSIARSLFA